MTDNEIYINSYDPTSGTWSPANTIFDLTTASNSFSLNRQDMIDSSAFRIDLNTNLIANGSEILMFQKDGDYNYIRRTGINNNIKNSPYLPTTNLDEKIVIYRLDANGNPELTLSEMSTSSFDALYITIVDNQTITGVKKFNQNKLLLAGVGGNITINGSQSNSSSSYTLEFPTAAPSNTLNVLTTSGSAPYSKLSWADLSNYALTSSFNQLNALNTTGSPTFANLTINSGGALNLNYMSSPASSDILATLNTNKQLTNSGVALSSLCTLGAAQTFTADKTFNYSSGKIKLSNYSTDNTTTNNLLTLNSNGYVVPCNKTYANLFSVADANTFTGVQTFNQDKLVLPTLTASISGATILTKNATTGAVENASSVAWNNIDLINSAQTITAIKTFDYSTSKITLSNTTNDTTSTNKLLVLNTNNYIVPCDKTYANTFKPNTFDIYDDNNVDYARLYVSNNVIMAQYYINGVASGASFSINGPPVTVSKPAIAWNFNTNVSSSYSTSGTYTLSSGSISANGKFSNCLTSANDIIITSSPEITPLTRATGYSYTVSYWFKISSWTSNDWRGVELKCTDSTSNFLVSNVQDTLAVAFGGAGNTAPTANITTTIFTTTSLGIPPFIGSSVYNDWSFCALRWDDALTTLSVIYYIGGTKYTQSSVITNSSHLSIIRTCTRYNSASGVIAPTLRITGIGTKSGIDDLRMWPTALSDDQVAAVYNSTTDVIT